MNKVYRVVWNKATQTWNAVQENAKAHGKSPSTGIVGSVQTGVYTAVRFVYTIVMSGVLVATGQVAWAATGTEYNVGTPSDNICYFDTTTQSVICGDGNTDVNNTYNGNTSKSVAVGMNAKVSGESNVALGASSVAGSTGGTALGASAKAVSNYSVAIGYEAVSNNTWDISIGRRAGADASPPGANGNVPDGRNIAIGDGALFKATNANNNTTLGTSAGAYMNGSHNIVMGAYANTNEAFSNATNNGSTLAQTGAKQKTVDGKDVNYVDASNTVAIGQRALATQAAGVAVGQQAKAFGTTSVAVGNGSRALGSNAVAMGNTANAGAAQAIAIGQNANYQSTAVTDPVTGVVTPAGYKTTGVSSIAVGQAVQAGSNDTVAIGKEATIDDKSLNTIVIGKEAKAVVATGVEKTDDSVVIGSKAQTNNMRNTVIGAEAVTTGKSQATAVGYKTQALGSKSTALGSNASVAAGADVGVAIGGDASVTAVSGVAMGSNAKAAGENGIAIGKGAQANAKDTISIGTGNIVSGVGSGAIGDPNTVSGAGSYALGNNNTVTTDKTFVIGNSVTQTLANSVILGDSSSASQINTGNYTLNGTNDAKVAGKPVAANGVVSVGSAGKERQIQNVAAGVVSATSTDAINGSQLYAVAEKAQHHYFSVNDRVTPSGNYDNDGAEGENALAAGVDTSAETIESVAIGYKAVVKDNGSAPTNQEGSVAIGSSVTVSGKASIGIGRNVKAEARNAVAIGDTAIANKDQAVAIARDAQATGVGAVAMGSASRSSGSHTTALGVAANASVSRSVALGSEAVADRAGFANPTTAPVTTSSASTFANKEVYAIDSATQGAKNAVIATVKNTTTNTYGAVSVGNGNVTRQIINVAAGSEDSDAVNVAQLKAVASAVAAGQTHYFSVKSDLSGADTNHANDGATGQNAIAVGLRSSSTATDSLAVGVDTKAAGNQSTAMGTSAKAEKVGATAVGNGAIASGESAVALGRSVTASGEEAFAAGRSSTASGARSTVIGKSASAAAGDSIVMGTNAKVEKTTSTSAVVIGNGAKATSSTTSTTDEGKDTVAIGFEAQTGASSNIAIGSKSKATGNAQATAIGYNTDAVGYQSIALGSGAKTTESGGSSVALGRDAQASHGNAVALGSASTTTSAVGTTDATVNDITYGGFAGTTPNSTVSVGNDTVKRTITNVAAGRINANSTDAINGSQLYITQQVLGNVANTTVDVLGGDAELTQSGVDAGKITMSDIGGTGKNTVHDAIAHVAQGFKVNTSASNGGSVSGNAEAVVKAGETVVVDAGKNIAITQDGKKISVATKDDVEFTSVTAGNTTMNTDGVTINNPADPTKNVSLTTTGLNNGGNKITNVANGTVAKDSKDAVNGDQLFTAAAAAKTEVTGSGLANVTKTTGANNQDIYNVEVATAAAPTVTRGNVTVAPADENKVMTAGDVAKAINASEKTSSVVAATGAAVTVAAGAEDANGNTEYTVDLSQGSKDSLAKADSALQDVVSTDPNLTATKNGDTVSLSFSDTPTFTSVTADTFTAGNTTINTDGLTIAGGPSITTAGINAGNKVISGVAPGVAGTDAVNVNQLNNQTAAAKTEVTGSGLANVTKTTGANNQDIYNVEVATAAAPTVTRGNVTVAPADENKVMTAGDVAKAINASEKTSSVVAATGAAVTVAAGAEDANGNTEYTVDLSQGSKDSLAKADSAVQSIKVKANGADVTTLDQTNNTLDITSGDNITVTDDNGKVKVGLAKDVTGLDSLSSAKVTAGTGANQVVLDNAGVNVGGNTYISGAGLNANDKKITNVAAGAVTATSKDAVNGSQLHAQGTGVQNIIGGNTVYNPQTGTYTNTDIGGTGKGTIHDAISAVNSKATQAKTTVTAGKNVVVSENKNTDGSTNYTVATADNLDVTSVKAGNTVLNNAGVKVGDNVALTNAGLTAGNVSVTNAGINAGGNKITGVAAGLADTDAVNVSQLNAVKDNMKTSSVSAGTAVTVTPTVSGNNTDYKVDLTDAAKADIAQGVSAKNTVDTKGLTFTGDTGTTGIKKLGDSVAVTGDSNITTTATGTGVQVKLNDNIAVNGANIGGVTINNSGINANDKVISGVASGLNGKTLDDIKADANAPERSNAATIGDLTTVQNNVTTISNNYTTTINKVIGGTTPEGKVTNANGETVKDVNGNDLDVADALKTYNVQGNHAKTDNTVITAIKNINEGGTKFFHVNDGTGTQNVEGSDVHTEDSAASGDFSAAIGYQAKSEGKNAIALGTGAQANAENTISIGTGNIVNGKNSGAIGDPSIINGTNSYSVGNHNTVATDSTFVLGNNVTQTLENSVILGDKSSAKEVHTTAAGGHYTYAGANDANVAGVNDVVGVVSVGTEGQTRQVQNVAAGVVSADSTDAINGSQLYHTNEAIGNVASYTANLGNQLSNRINDVEDGANAGVSSAMAMAALPQAYIPGKSMLTGGMASYNGEGAVAVGLSKLSDNGRWVLKVSGSADTQGNAGAAIGAGFHF